MMELIGAVCIGLLVGMPSWAGLILAGVTFWPSLFTAWAIFLVAFLLTLLVSVAVRVGS